MSRVVTLAGWGQPCDALQAAAPDAVHLDYASAQSIEQAMSLLAEKAGAADTVVGWSLGGQLAVCAIARHVIAPRQLVLIAAPFQFVARDSLPLGMERGTFSQYYEQYRANPRRALKKFVALVAHGDSRREEVSALLGEPSQRCDWLPWLDALAGFSAHSLDFSGFPPTILLHGLQDAVVHPDQSRAYADRIPRATLELWPHAAHAPHLHDIERFKTWMAEYAA